MNTPTDWNKAVKTCGTGIATSHLDYTKVVGRDGAAHLPHTNLCKSWNCPHCSSVKSVVYGEKINALATAQLEAGKNISFITLTAGFAESAGAEFRLKALQKLWKKTQKSIQRTYNNFGYIRRIEFTINKAKGFPHFHIHALLMFDEVISQFDQDKISTEFLLRWMKNVRKEKLSVVEDGQDYQRITDARGISNYLAKTISMEMTSSNTKNGKGMNWFDFLEDNETFSKDKKERIIRDILDATLGKRLITFSRDINVCYKKLEAEEEALNGGDTEEVENDYEIEMLTSCANVLLKLHTQQAHSFIDHNIHTEDILELIHISPLYRMRFTNICNDTIEMREHKFDGDEIISYFLSNLEFITLRSAVFPSMSDALPSPA